MRKKVTRTFILLAVCSLLLLVACQESGPMPCNEGNTLFNDDFGEEQDCGWVMYSQGGASAAISNGALHLTTSQPGQIWWTNPGRNMDDVIMTATAQFVSGPIDNAYGLICRYQSPENFYVFLISSDGYYAIGKYQSGSSQIVYLNEGGEYVFSEAIGQGEANNSLRVECRGDTLTFGVNGVVLEEVVDPTFVTGDIGVAASTFESGTVDVAFDNVRVIAP